VNTREHGAPRLHLLRVPRTFAAPAVTVTGLTSDATGFVAFASPTFYASVDGSSWTSLASLAGGDTAVFVADATAAYAIDSGPLATTLLRIARADGAVTTLASEFPGTALAQDADNLYFTAQSVMRIPKSGGAATAIVNGAFDTVFVGGGDLYWADASSSAGVTFWRSSLATISGTIAGSISPPSCPWNLGAWGAWGNEVVCVFQPRGQSAGCNPISTVVATSGAVSNGSTDPSVFVVDGPNAYYVDDGMNLSRFAMDTHENTALVASAAPTALATDASCLYYADGSGIHAIAK
jgi:hypothetical protein